MGDSTTYSSILSKGLESNLPAVENGKIRYTTDSKKLFVEDGTSRVEITDVVKGYNTSAILQISTPLDKVYLASDTLHLYYYANNTWNDLNSVSIENISPNGLDFGDEDAILDLGEET